MATRITRRSYEQALARGYQALEAPHAVSGRYLATAHVLELVYSNGRVLRIDPQDIATLRELPPSMLSRAYVTPGGDGLLFGEDGEVAVSIPGLVKRWGEYGQGP